MIEKKTSSGSRPRGTEFVLILIVLFVVHSEGGDVLNLGPMSSTESEGHFVFFQISRIKTQVCKEKVTNLRGNKVEI